MQLLIIRLQELRSRRLNRLSRPLPPVVTPPPARSVRVTFLPPPLDGTISLGIYDAKGKLVRVLKREADINEFNVGNDALWTTWDGKDDAGNNAPAGRYNAHGLVVGDLKIEGVGFFLQRLDQLGEGSPRVPPAFKSGAPCRTTRSILLAVDLVPATERATCSCLRSVRIKALILRKTPGRRRRRFRPLLHQAASAGDPGCDRECDAGRDGNTLWVIDPIGRKKASSTVEVKQFSANGEFLRRLPILPNEPVFRQSPSLRLSRRKIRIYLVEESLGHAVNRVARAQPGLDKNRRGRACGLRMESRIRKIDRDAQGILGRGRQNRFPPIRQNSGASRKTLKVKLQANPLLE